MATPKKRGPSAYWVRLIGQAQSLKPDDLARLSPEKRRQVAAVLASLTRKLVWEDDEQIVNNVAFDAGEPYARAMMLAEYFKDAAVHTPRLADLDGLSVPDRREARQKMDVIDRCTKAVFTDRASSILDDLRWLDLCAREPEVLAHVETDGDSLWRQSLDERERQRCTKLFVKAARVWLNEKRGPRERARDKYTEAAAWLSLERGRRIPAATIKRTWNEYKADNSDR